MLTTKKCVKILLAIQDKLKYNPRISYKELFGEKYDEYYTAYSTCVDYLDKYYYLIETYEARIIYWRVWLINEVLAKSLIRIETSAMQPVTLKGHKCVTRSQYLELYYNGKTPKESAEDIKFLKTIRFFKEEYTFDKENNRSKLVKSLMDQYDSGRKLSNKQKQCLMEIRNEIMYEEEKAIDRLNRGLLSISEWLEYFGIEFTKSGLTKLGLYVSTQYKIKYGRRPINEYGKNYYEFDDSQLIIDGIIILLSKDLSMPIEEQHKRIIIEQIERLKQC